MIPVDKRDTTIKLEKMLGPLSVGSVDQAVQNLYDAAIITESELIDYKEGITGKNLRSSLRHLGVHCTIGLATVSPLSAPISAILRPSYTLGHNLWYRARGEPDQARIHNWRVVCLSALPLPFPLSALTNGAYILSIMQESPAIALAICDNMVQAYTDKDLRTIMAKMGTVPHIRSMSEAGCSISKYYLSSLLTMAKIGMITVLRSAAQMERATSNMPVMSTVKEVVLGKNTKQAYDYLLDMLFQEEPN